MHNQPISSSNPLIAKGWAKSTVNSSTPKPTISGSAFTATSTVFNKPSAMLLESFGALLAQQMDKTILPSEPSHVIANQVNTDPTIQTGKNSHVIIPAATDISGDPSSALAAMLQMMANTPINMGVPTNITSHAITSGQMTGSALASTELKMIATTVTTAAALTPFQLPLSEASADKTAPALQANPSVAAVDQAAVKTRDMVNNSAVQLSVASTEKASVQTAPALQANPSVAAVDQAAVKTRDMVNNSVAHLSVASTEKAPVQTAPALQTNPSVAAVDQAAVKTRDMVNNSAVQLSVASTEKAPVQTAPALQTNPSVAAVDQEAVKTRDMVNNSALSTASTEKAPVQTAPALQTNPSVAAVDQAASPLPGLTTSSTTHKAMIPATTDVPEQAPSTALFSVSMPNVPLNTDTQQTIATPLGNHGWAEEFLQKINLISMQQNQTVELHMNPPNLGPLDVVLKISDNQATAMFTSPHEAVRDAVENALPKLREILADNGITLGNTMVSDQPQRDAERFMGQGSRMTAKRDNPNVDPVTDNLLSAATQRRHNGMVDTYA